MDLRHVRRTNIGRRRPLFNEKLQEKIERIKKFFPYPILYFPTYRRVEEDLRNLGITEEKELARDEQLIQFGMSDVKSRFDRITSEIRDSSVEWYSVQNGKMLSQLIGGIQKESIDMKSLENPEVFRIVLDRIGENISLEDKQHILQLIASKQIKQDQYLHLSYFLLNLVQVYDRQRSNDNAIKDFARVTNEYLTDKEVRYNESKVDIQIVNKRSGVDMPLDRLSSGEKQVVSIFSRLFLEKSNEPYALFFDEPELSLSMEWQKKLLSDIVSSQRCIFLLAATHSPFIFENELDKYAEALKVKFIGEA
jgi:predicted ATP-dependent endonuclease of OLD family